MATGTALYGCLGRPEHLAGLASPARERDRPRRNDQLDRYATLFTPVGLVVTGVAGDAARRAAVRQIAQRGGLQTGADYAAAALVFQHGATPADYQQANRYAERAIDLGSERGRWLYAASRDRYLRSIDEPQQFGTQYRLESGTWQLVL